MNAADRPAGLAPDLQLEIAHLLLLDVVGYSKLLVEEQVELINEFTQIVRATECFRNAARNGKLIRVPTGDGMALVFFSSPEEPARCALEISRALQTQAQQGFTEVIVRNPETDEERVLVIPTLQSGSGKQQE